MTREELRTRILTHLFDDPLNPVFWTTAEIDAFITEAQEISAEEVRAVRRTVFLPKRDGTQIYDLRTVADDCMAPYRVWDHSANQRLTPVTMKQLDADRYRWLSTTGSQPFYWWPVSYGRFGIHPATATGGGLLRVDYLSWSTPLLDDGDSPEGSESNHDAFVVYGEYLGLVQQYEVARATERFIQFTKDWRDDRARNEVKRLQTREPQRRRGRE